MKLKPNELSNGYRNFEMLNKEAVSGRTCYMFCTKKTFNSEQQQPDSDCFGCAERVIVEEDGLVIGRHTVFDGPVS